MVNSEWSKTALVEQGVSAGKIEVIPIAYEPGTEVEAAATSVSSSGPLRVLWLGSVILRKGIQYLIQAAQQLEDRPIRFDVVGPIGISEKGLSEAPPNMTFHGRVPRDEADDWYARSDAFVLPTLSDGFAITQLEAMAHGLPVIATPNCGSVVDDGTHGRIVPVRDPEALAEAIAQLDEDRSQLQGMAAAARERVKRYHPQRVSSQLLEMVASRLQTDGVSH
jgi:glycosyltransferase involved in cell wall biosynthesis